jgi:hypothetical protein
MASGYDWCQLPKSTALMSGVLCTRQLRVSGLPEVIAGRALGEGGAELAGGGGQDQGNAADHHQDRDSALADIAI